MDSVANPAPDPSPMDRARGVIQNILGDDARTVNANVDALTYALALVIDELERNRYACPRCWRIVPGLALVSCNVGMTRQLPFWACDPCIVDLEQQEAHTPTTIAGYIWDVTLEGPTEGRVDALERRRRAREV